MSTSWHHPQKYNILHRMATDPDLSAMAAAELFGVHHTTIKRWCKEEGISLAGHKHPRVSFILKGQLSKRTRLIKELAQCERMIKALREQDPDAPYRKPRKA
jgi:hypothetical protein